MMKCLLLQVLLVLNQVCKTFYFYFSFFFFVYLLFTEVKISCNISEQAPITDDQLDDLMGVVYVDPFQCRKQYISVLRSMCLYGDSRYKALSYCMSLLSHGIDLPTPPLAMSISSGRFSPLREPCHSTIGNVNNIVM